MLNYPLGQVKEAEQHLRHKLFPPNAWMKVADFHVLTSCPKDELHQWFIGLYGEHIIPADQHVAVVITRSTRGCGHSGTLSLALAACLCPKLNGSARRPGLRLLREAGRRGRQDIVLLVQNDGYTILGIYQVYTAIYTF